MGYALHKSARLGYPSQASSEVVLPLAAGSDNRWVRGDEGRAWKMNSTSTALTSLAYSFAEAERERA
jgi:hypothetical protein